MHSNCPKKSETYSLKGSGIAKNQQMNKQHK